MFVRKNNPANIRLDEDVLKTSWRRLQNVFIKTNIFALLILLQKTCSRRFLDILIKTTIFVLVIRVQAFFKTSWSRPTYSSWSYVFKTSSRRFQGVFKTSCQDFFETSSRRLVKTSTRYPQDVFKKFSRRLQDVLQKCLQDVFKTFWRRLQDVLEVCFQDVFKTYHQVKLFLLTRFQDVFETYTKRFWDALQRRLSIEGFA